MKEQRWCADCGAGRLNNQFDYELTDVAGVVRDFCGVTCLATWTAKLRSDTEYQYPHRTENRDAS
jgi:hypothetical protein